MSKKRYRSKPGLPRTETEAMIRAMAIEMLDGALGELEQEIAVVNATVNLYYAEVRERAKNPTADHGRWQVAPGVGLRAAAMLRKLREKRDAMLSEAEAEIVEEASRNNTAKPAKEAEGNEPVKESAPAENKPDWNTVAKDVADIPVPQTASSAREGGTEKRKRDPVQAA